MLKKETFFGGNKILCHHKYIITRLHKTWVLWHYKADVDIAIKKGKRKLVRIKRKKRFGSSGENEKKGRREKKKMDFGIFKKILRKSLSVFLSFFIYFFFYNKISIKIEKENLKIETWWTKTFFCLLTFTHSFAFLFSPFKLTQLNKS